MQVHIYQFTDPPGTPWMTVNAMQMTPWLSFDEEVTSWGRTGYIQRFLVDGSIPALTGYLKETSTAGRIQIVVGSNQELKIIEAVPIIDGATIHCWLVHAVRQVHLIVPSPPPDPPVLRAPVGMMLPWAPPTIIPGWDFAWGQPVSRTGLPELYSLIGVNFGVGDGVTTFNLPDTRKRFPRGADSTTGAGNNLGDVGGAATVTLIIANLPPHGHQVPYSLNLGSSGTVRLGDAGTGGQFTTGLSNGLSTPFGIVPPYQNVNWIIKTQMMANEF